MELIEFQVWVEEQKMKQEKHLTESDLYELNRKKDWLQYQINHG